MPILPDAVHENAAPAPAVFAATSAADLVAPLAAAMPTVTEKPITADPQQPTPAAPVEAKPDRAANASALTAKDRAGRKFDPVKFAVDADGNPRTDKNGLFFSKNVGRPAGPSKPKPAPTPKAPAAPQASPFQRERPTFLKLDGVPSEPMFEDAAPITGAAVPMAPVDIFGPMADGYLRVTYAPLAAFFSADIIPDEDEHAALRVPLAEILRRAKSKELDPKLLLFITAVGIFTKKIQEKPTVRERFEMLKLRVTQIWLKWRANGKPENAL